MDIALDAEYLGTLRKEFESEPVNRLMQNAVTKVSVTEVGLDREVANRADHTFSNLLDDWKVTDQGHSGRCWLFAGLNLVRVGIMAKTGLKDFELSQNHAMFWDKIERANYLLEATIATAEKELDDRVVAHLLDAAADDGGQWNMFVAVVRKHGLVPKAFMPETESSKNTGKMNSILRRVLRQGVKTVREAARSSADEARVEKAAVLQVFFRVLAIHLGLPPERFLWQWTDKDRNFHRDGEITPVEFARRYVDLPLDDYVCLVNDPRPSSPYGRTFTVEHLGNVVGAPPVTYLNVEVGLLKDLAARAVSSGQPVWFGCDVGQMMSNELGLWDASLYDLESVYSTTFTLSKAERLLYHETAMDHAMLFTGVDVVDGSPRRWRVENSWGKDKGRDGFYTMNDSWFDEFVFEVAVRRQMLPEHLQAALTEPPIVLPAWDPMGSLAG